MNSIRMKASAHRRPFVKTELIEPLGWDLAVTLPQNSEWVNLFLWVNGYGNM
jgi:hypothetical protein